MRQILPSILAIGLGAAPALSTEGYSFKTYLSDRGGCDAHRKILDKRLREIRYDYVHPGRSNRGQGIELFGQPASAWTEGDIRVVLDSYRDCEDRLFQSAAETVTNQPTRDTRAKTHEIALSRALARIEESLREIMSADRSNTIKADAGASGRPGKGEGEAASDRWSREWSQRGPGGRLPGATLGRSEADEAMAAESAARAGEAVRQLDDARRAAAEVEHRRMRDEAARAEPRVGDARRPIAERLGRGKDAEAFAIAPKPVADRLNCTVTRDGFDQVQRGMSLDRVEALIGCRGTLSTTTTSPDLGRIEVQVWDDRRSFSTVTVQFMNSVVFSKSQVGLN